MTAVESSVVVQEEKQEKKEEVVCQAASDENSKAGVVGEKEKDGTSSEKTENNPEKTGEARGDNGVEPKLIETADAEDAPAAEQPKDIAGEARLHLIQGKRKMLVQDYSTAVEFLQKSCELFAAKFGDDAFESAEALHFYGKALLELHRKESDALNELGGQQVGAEDSSEEDASGGDNDDNDGDDEEEEQESTGSDGKEKTDETSGRSKELEEVNLEEEPNTMVGETEAEADEDVTNLQIAFEVLELAKKIYKRDAMKNPDLYLKAADCLLALGEINLESDTYDRAVEDFEECLRIQQEMLPPDARVLAETNYQLGLTYSFMNKFEQSAAYFMDALQILKLKISNLENTIERNEAKATIEADSVQVDVVRSAKEEIDEIQSILPEISAKIEDAKESMREGAHLPKEAIINEMLNRNPEVSPEKRDTKVNVINSNLIKRKRPLAEEPGASGSSSNNQQEKRHKASSSWSSDATS